MAVGSFVRVDVVVRDGVRVNVAVRVGVGVRVRVGVRVIVGVRVLVGVRVTVGVREAVGELLQVVHRMPGTGRIVGTTVGAAIDITSFVILIRGLTKTRLNDGYSGTLPFVP